MTTISGSFSGISLPSLLQMLEQEQKSCVLCVEAGDKHGKLFIQDGDLIDCEYGDIVGRDGADILLSLENPVLLLEDGENRKRRIDCSLGHILFDFATRQNEYLGKQAVKGTACSAGSSRKEGGAISDKRQLLDVIASVSEIKKYCLLNRRGKVIASSFQDKIIADYITSCVVVGIKMRRTLAVRGLHSIQVIMDNNEMLLILSGAGMICGLQLSGDALVAKVVVKLRPVLIAGVE